MTKSEYIQFWKTSAEKDWEVAQNLFEKKNYPQSLFFGHLALEKLLKAHWVKDNQEDFPPRIHNLNRLSEDTRLVLSPEDLAFLDKMNDFQLEGRYPDYQFKIYQLCTPVYTEEILKEVKRLVVWLTNQLP